MCGSPEPSVRAAGLKDALAAAREGSGPGAGVLSFLRESTAGLCQESCWRQLRHRTATHL